MKFLITYFLKASFNQNVIIQTLTLTYQIKRQKYLEKTKTFKKKSTF